MLLTIRTLSCPPPDTPQSIQAQFNATGGRIGRSPPCTLILPDPNRHISREHAEIRYRDQGFSLKVVSKVNSVVVNDAVLNPGEAVELNDGDQILIGEYLLRADISSPAVASSPSASPFAPPASAGSAGSPFDVFDRLAPAPAPPMPDMAPDWFRSAPTVPVDKSPVGGQGLDDFFKPTTEASKFADVMQATPPPSGSAAFMPPAVSSPADNRLDEFLGLGPAASIDPVSDPLRGSELYRASPLDLPLHAASQPVVPPAAPAPTTTAFPGHDDIFKALEQDFGALVSPPSPPVFHPAPAVVPPAVLAPVAPLAPSAPMPTVPPVATQEPLGDLANLLTPGRPSPPELPSAVVAPATMPAASPLQTARPLPPVEPPMPAMGLSEDTPTLQLRTDVLPAASLPGAQPAAGMPNAGADAAEVQRLMQVLCEAMGLAPGDIDTARPEETIRLVGELLRLSTDGLFRLLEMRSQLKSELHIDDRTMIASRENNPLKHADSARDAIAYLVDTRQHGNKLFMPPSKAVEDTIWDICAHEMAVMAGTRAALLAALKMFSPEVIEGRIKKTGALENVLPALHKSRLWERFLGMYAELQHEAEDHFDRLLNQEFSKAYSEQSRKLKKKR